MRLDEVYRLGRVALLVAIVLGVGLVAGPVLAGAISLSWNPVSDSDLAGYRVYRGTSPGQLDDMLDVGNTTSTTLSGLTDCTTWYVSVRAYDTGGLESSSDSNLVKGLPRPIVSSLDQNTIHQGETLTFAVSGTNFDVGDAADPNHPAASVSLSHSGLVVEDTQVDACGTIHVRIRARGDAAEGFSSLTVNNPDLSFSDPEPHPWVYGTLEDAIEVVAAEQDQTPPTVDSTSPGAGESGVPVSTTPRVTFSEALDAASVTSETVQLLDSAGRAVVQESGWPTLDGAVVTLRPASPLGEGASYRIFVRGGASGVKDLAGNPLASDYTQDPGFTAAVTDRPDSDQPRVIDADPAAGQVGVSSLLREVRVTFDRDMSGLRTALSGEELRQRFAVLSEGVSLRQTSESPRFESGGRTVAILLNESLKNDHAYTTLVHLADPSLETRLANRGLGGLFMDQVWMSRPSWRVEGALDRISYRDPQGGAETELIPALGDMPASSSGVPEQAEFRVTFNRPVVPSTANDDVFRVLAAVGRRYQPVPLQQVRRSTDGRTVILKPKQPLPSGSWGMVQVRTGALGVYLIGDGGEFFLPAGSAIGAPFATKVDPQQVADSFGVAE